MVPLILFFQVRRGGCHFAQKVKVAQDSKDASAVIIVDDEGSTRTPSEIRTIIMADGQYYKYVNNWRQYYFHLLF